MTIDNIKNDAEIVWKYLTISDKPQKADCIYILGGSTLAPVYKAVELYQKGFAPKIINISIGGTFGGHKRWKMSEAEKYKQILINNNIPLKDILTARVSTNTYDEARGAIPFMKTKGIIPRKVILISRPVHQRRAFATLSKQWPNIIFINCPAEEKLNSKNKSYLKRLIQEYNRLIKYSIKGDIANQDLPGNVTSAIKRIRIYCDH